MTYVWLVYTVSDEMENIVMAAYDAEVDAEAERQRSEDTDAYGNPWWVEKVVVHQ